MRTVVGSVALTVGLANAISVPSLGFLFDSMWIIVGPACLAAILLSASLLLLRKGPGSPSRVWLIIVPALIAGLAGGASSGCGTYSVSGDTERLWVRVFGMQRDLDSGPSELMQAKMALWAMFVTTNGCVAVASAAGAIAGAFIRRRTGGPSD